MKKSTIKKWEKWIDKRSVRTFFLTMILFIIGYSDYLIQKTIEKGIFALPVGFALVWAILIISRVDKFIFK